MPATARSSPLTPPSYIVIGTSAGGFAALSRIFKHLPVDFPGAILIVMHVSSNGGFWLTERLARVGHIEVKLAQHGESVRQRTAYIAPPGTHMLVREGRIRLGVGPREQHSRPSIDVLFRSVAAEYGPRVVGVILTGMLKDGTAGLRSVREAGGITVVQDPTGAEHGDMPRNAMDGLEVDYCLALDEIGPLLELLVRRAGSLKRGVLETGLASSIRLMKDRARLLAKLSAQSERNPRTMEFLDAECAALERDIDRVRRMLPTRNPAQPRRAPVRGRAVRKRRLSPTGR